jgi:hypothetical protein
MTAQRDTLTTALRDIGNSRLAERAAELLNTLKSA